MMIADEIVSRARASGITLAAVDGRIAVKPASRMTEELRALFAEHRQELVAHLSSSTANHQRPAEGEDTSAARWWRWLIHLPAQTIELDFASGCTEQEGRDRIKTLYPDAVAAIPLLPVPLAAAADGSMHDEDEAAVRRWIQYIGEIDETIIGSVLEQCRADPEALAYFRGRAAEAPEPREGYNLAPFEITLTDGQRIAFDAYVPVASEQHARKWLLQQAAGCKVRCADCGHFALHADHPALGNCAAGVAATGAGGLHWGADKHCCARFIAAQPP